MSAVCNGNMYCWCVLELHCPGWALIYCNLMSFSCSGAVDVDLFQKILAGAVFDAGKDVWAVERFGAGADHPLLMTYPEGEYLKGMHLLMRSDGFV